MNRKFDTKGSVSRHNDASPGDISSTELRLLSTGDGTGSNTPLVPQPDGIDPGIQFDNQIMPRRINSFASKLRHHRWEFSLAFAALILSVFSFYYSYEALLSPDPALGKLNFPPPTTIFVINVLSQGVVWMLMLFFSSVFVLLRWNFASRTSGVPLTTFLALSPGTTLSGVVRLLHTRGPHQWWCAQRYRIFWFQGSYNLDLFILHSFPLSP